MRARVRRCLFSCTLSARSRERLRAHSPPRPFPLIAGHEAGLASRVVSYGILPNPYPSPHAACVDEHGKRHNLGGLEISGEEEVTVTGVNYVSSLYVTCTICSRIVTGKPKKGRKVNLHDKVRLKAAQKLVAEFGFPKKVKGKAAKAVVAEAVEVVEEDDDKDDEGDEEDDAEMDFDGPLDDEPEEELEKELEA